MIPTKTPASQYSSPGEIFVEMDACTQSSGLVISTATSILRCAPRAQRRCRSFKAPWLQHMRRTTLPFPLSIPCSLHLQQCSGCRRARRFVCHCELARTVWRDISQAQEATRCVCSASGGPWVSPGRTESWGCGRWVCGRMTSIRKRLAATGSCKERFVSGTRFCLLFEQKKDYEPGSWRLAVGQRRS